MLYLVGLCTRVLPVPTRELDSLRAAGHLWHVSFGGVPAPRTIPNEFSGVRRTSGKSGTVDEIQKPVALRRECRCVRVFQLV